ncbi:MAG: hypothetical protein H7Y88_04875 [Phycisphaerales bacterium]|nr:hypothetical protein [Phycisphaerales bacterium]
MRSCPQCGYDLAGLAEGPLTCPECGYGVTAQDLILSERRSVYLELTKWRLSVIHPFWILLAFGAYGHLALFVVLPLIGAQIVGWAMVRAGSKGVFQTLAGRVWRMTVPILSILCTLPLLSECVFVSVFWDPAPEERVLCAAIATAIGALSLVVRGTLRGNARSSGRDCPRFS